MLPTSDKEADRLGIPSSLSTRAGRSPPGLGEDVLGVREDCGLGAVTGTPVRECALRKLAERGRGVSGSFLKTKSITC